jgi:asparagine synthetase B (glutamine-hydrolysing)
VGGIVGKLSFDRRVRISDATVRRMIDAVGHRGAASRSYLGHGIALGSCDREPLRCSQVAHNESGTIRVVADAELSNAGPLERTLARLGHCMRGSTDAELIAHAYEEWGDACVEQLSGPFACAIWDDIERRLLLARDRFGIRPLCFALLHGDGVVFGSEVTALLQEPAVGREWHPEAVDAYLALGYVPAPLTMYRSVSKLEPAHTLVVDGRRLTTRQYWSFSAAESFRGPENEAADLLESSLRRSVVSLADESDAGVLVSGGIASTTISTLLPHGRSSVTAALEESGSDLARLSDAATHLGLRSAIESTRDATCIAGLLAQRLDEPVADPAAVAQYAAFVAARRHMHVALTGHGAAFFWPGHHGEGPFDDALRHEVYTRQFLSRVRDASPFVRHGWVPDKCLTTADRASAIAGIGLRHPSLDGESADAAFRLRSRTSRDAAGIDILRQVAGRRLPAALIPLVPRTGPARWLCEAVSALVPGVLLTGRLEARGIFSRSALEALWDEYRSGRRDHAGRLWSVLMLELWFRGIIDGDAAAQPPEHGVLVRAA